MCDGLERTSWQRSRRQQEGRLCQETSRACGIFPDEEGFTALQRSTHGPPACNSSKPSLPVENETQGAVSSNRTLRKRPVAEPDAESGRSSDEAQNGEVHPRERHIVLRMYLTEPAAVKAQ